MTVALNQEQSARLDHARPPERSTCRGAHATRWQVDRPPRRATPAPPQCRSRPSCTPYSRRLRPPGRDPQRGVVLRFDRLRHRVHRTTINWRSRQLHPLRLTRQRQRRYHRPRQPPARPSNAHETVRLRTMSNPAELVFRSCPYRGELRPRHMQILGRDLRQHLSRHVHATSVARPTDTFP